MLKTYFITSLRSILKHKLTTALNVLGLAAGLASGMLIMKYVQDELSYDRFHTQKNRIYRVQHDFLKEGAIDFQSARTYPKVGPAMLAEFGEVENYCRIFKKYKGGIVRYEDLSFQEENLIYADTSFLSIFDYELTQGNRATALSDSHTALIEEKVAVKYFGMTDPIGKRISVGSMHGVEEFEITGVIKSPENSHLKFELVFSYASLIDLFGNSAHDVWGNWYDFYTYLLLKPDVDVTGLEVKFPALADKYGGDRSGSKRIQLSLQPLTDIHLYSDLMMEARANGDAKTIYFLSILAIAILLIAWINYLNMATASAMERAKEVGVKKVTGATRLQLGIQFVAEAAVINFCAMLASFVIIILALPAYNLYSGYHVIWTDLFGDFAFWDKVALLWVFGSLVSGVYPALVLSSFDPVKVLKGNLKSSGHGILLRKVLVVTQFTASVILIAGTLIVYRQLQFIQRQSLGVDINQVMVVKAPDVITDQNLYNRTLEAYKSEILRGPNIEAVTVASEIPGRGVSWYMRSFREGDDINNDPTVIYAAVVDADYFKLLGIELVAGRFYSTDTREDSTNVILNEKAIEMLRFESAEQALQQRVRISRRTYTIVGVVKNYYHESPKEAFDPTAYLLMNEEKVYFAIRTTGADFFPALNHAESTFKNIFPGAPFDYFFLNDFYNQQFENDSKFNSLFNAFSLIAIIVASLGLFGLASFTISQRRREVGVRKALGASIQVIFLLFTKDFMKLIVIANAMAVPLVLVIMEQWLDNFAQKITIGVGVFVVSALATVVIAMASVGYHALKAALVNPVETLRCE